jgi:hypothetical protein
MKLAIEVQEVLHAEQRQITKGVPRTKKDAQANPEDSIYYCPV